MATVIFWEKPGCKGNAKQKAILLASGHQLDVRNLLTERWDEPTLRLFFGSKAVSVCFNPSNPQIKSGQLDPKSLSQEEALKLMVAEPLLIVRPLMQVGDQYVAGFDVDEVDAWIGLKGQTLTGEDPRNCPCVTNVCDPVDTLK